MLQVITAELLTKYKVIMFSSIGEMCDEKFQVHSKYNVLKNSKYRQTGSRYLTVPKSAHTL
jgi:hypothetical protein